MVFFSFKRCEDSTKVVVLLSCFMGLRIIHNHILISFKIFILIILSEKGIFN